MEISHARDTICNFKRLLGRKYQDLFVQQEKILNAYSIVEGNIGSVNIEVDLSICERNESDHRQYVPWSKVNYLNERKRFTPEQITAIMLTKLQQISDSDLGAKSTDCVLGVSQMLTENFYSIYFFSQGPLLFYRRWTTSDVKRCSNRWLELSPFVERNSCRFESIFIKENKNKIDRRPLGSQ